MSKNKDGAVNALVLDYLNKQNRPYSAIDIFNNLHKQHGKTAITKSLEQLAADHSIVEKTYGKQKIYYAVQSQFPDVSEDELRSMDSVCNNLTTSLSEIQSCIKTCEAELGSLNSSLTTSEIERKIKELQEENSKLEAKLENLKNNENAVAPEEKELINKNFQANVKEWRKRKRITTEMLNAILEGYPKPKKVLYEELQIETDEDVKVSIPDTTYLT